MRITEQAIEKIRPTWNQIETTKLATTRKVLTAFQEERVSDYHFTNSSGYGYNDTGRETLEAVYARVFKTESALVRPQLVSGTHAISVALFGNLYPGDELVSLSGSPYDTLQQVIGTSGNARTSLLRHGIRYKEIPLLENGQVDFTTIEETVTPQTKMVMLQRSRGYSWRSALSIEQIKETVEFVKALSPETIFFVDNCYGEFVDILEPTEVGVDLMAGSLIKNPGGTIATSGGYVVGRNDLVENAADRLTAPGLGMEVGPTFGMVRMYLQGLFLAPHIVGEALMGAALLAQVFSDLGFEVSPLSNEKRSDIVQAIKLGNPEMLKDFCIAVQASSPVDSHVQPTPSPMPGYDSEIIMAAGTFVQWSSIELSADAPLREPYIVYVQGGTSKEQVMLTVESIILSLRNKGYCDRFSS